jgi:uncharacterized protein (DUF1778 family)
MATTALAERLEARITSEQKEIFKEAAAVRGVSLTDFIVSSVHEAAVRTLEARHAMNFGRRDQQTFVQALLHPEPPNQNLRKAVRRQGYARRTTRSRKP